MPFEFLIHGIIHKCIEYSKHIGVLAGFSIACFGLLLHNYDDTKTNRNSKLPKPLSFMPAIHIQTLQLTISKNQWNYHDKIPRQIKNFIRTADTFPLFTKHRVAGQPLYIPLMYNLALWNNFLIKKSNSNGVVRMCILRAFYLFVLSI